MHSQVYDILVQQIMSEQTRNGGGSGGGGTEDDVIIKQFIERLFSAIKEGNVNTLNTFLKASVTKVRDNSGYGPLVVASGHGKDDMVRALVDAGCNILSLSLLTLRHHFVITHHTHSFSLLFLDSFNILMKVQMDGHHSFRQ